MQNHLSILRSCPFFTGLNEDEILSILHCVQAVEIARQRGAYIFRAGDSTEVMGLVLSGTTLVIQEDLWGHRNILSKCSAGDFWRAYAAAPGAILNISVVAEEDCEILLLNIKRLLTACPTACDHHQKLIRNLVSSLQTRYCSSMIRLRISASEPPGKSCSPIFLPSRFGREHFPLTFPLTGSSWRISSVWSALPCQLSCQSCKRRAF